MSELDDFLGQIASLPAMIAPAVDKLEPPTRTALSTPEIHGLRQIILTGSGDSYFAAAAIAPMLRALTGLPVQAMVSIEASRYGGGVGTRRRVGARGTLVIAISYSGEAARLVEAAARWRANGAITLGLTANPNGRLANAVERWLDTGIEASASAPGTRPYVSTLICLYLLAVRIAEVQMAVTMDEANALRRALSALGETMAGLDARCSPKLKAVAETWRGARSMDLLGSGPSLASAQFAAAKLVEAAGVHAVVEDAEEFFHLNYFVENPARVPAILFAPSNAAFASRAKELAETLAQLGRPSLVITDSPDLAADETALILPAVSEFLAPIVQTIPAALFAAFAAEVRGAVYYRGYEGPWRGSLGAGLVRNSPIDLSTEQ